MNYYEKNGEANYANPRAYNSHTVSK